LMPDCLLRAVTITISGGFFIAIKIGVQ
jgi:hypothetical protein